MPMTEDFSVFFNTNEFADAATLDGVAVSGIFDNGYSEVFALSTHDSRFTCADSATTAAAGTSSVLIVRGITYRVRSVQSDGTGISVILLERQGP